LHVFDTSNDNEIRNYQIPGQEMRLTRVQVSENHKWAYLLDQSARLIDLDLTSGESKQTTLSGYAKDLVLDWANRLFYVLISYNDDPGSREELLVFETQSQKLQNVLPLLNDAGRSVFSAKYNRLFILNDSASFEFINHNDRIGSLVVYDLANRQILKNL